MGETFRLKAKVAQYTITYFPLRGRSETFRFLLADQGCEWQEDEVPIKEWFEGKNELKKTAMFGQVPMFTDGDFTLFQSNAILRYLGRKHDLYGKDNKEAALIDMGNDGAEDLRMTFVKWFYKDDWEACKEQYLEELPSHLRPFECLLAKNASGFLVGNKVSFADFNLLDVLYNNLIIFPDCLKDFPHLTAFREKMEARPKLKAYLECEGHKNRIIHPYRKLW